MIESKFWGWLNRYDYTFFGVSTAIFIMGVVNLYSATHLSTSSTLANLYKVQISWYIISLIVGWAISLVKPQTLFRVSYVFYFVVILLLCAVYLLGHKGMGAQRWLVLGPLRIQPSELMKIAVVMALARWMSAKNLMVASGLKQLIVPAIIALVPTLLIIIEPDLGTGLLILLISGVIAFYCRIKKKTLLVIFIAAVATGGLVYKFGLKNYQRRRISTFLNPSQDAKGAGYNGIQSRIAIGSGQLWGKGFKKSSQASLNYLPENHTDFVFSIFNEEHGLLGSFLLITLYIILFLRYIWLATVTARAFDSIMAIGIMSIFYWHTFINMGMVMGLLPIVGLPLPFMSYGGSSILTFGICNGIATSISNSRNFF